MNAQLHNSPAVAEAVRGRGAAGARKGVLRTWMLSQPLNLARHAAALRPFKRDEFGRGPAAPTEAHIGAVNSLMHRLRRQLLGYAKRMGRVAQRAADQGTTQLLESAVTVKERAHSWVMATEKIWDFYFELFGQRQSVFGPWLLSCDRIALDCYQYTYLGLGKAKTIPTPPPFSYMRTGFSPATYRRGIPLSKLGRQLNPFPLVQLPYHRLVNPWTLGAVLHEVSHNIQTDLGLSKAVPERIHSALVNSGTSAAVAKVWAGWNREMFADMSGLFLGGPCVVGSLMDVVGRSPRATYFYMPGKPHPVPYLRTLISVEQLRRMGFEADAAAYGRAWKRIYTDPASGNIPRAVLETFDDAVKVVVDAVCFRPFATLGNKSLAQVIRFEAKEQQMIEEASTRLAAGTDPGIIPERFLIGAARLALERKLARPGVITKSFYSELSRR